MGIWFGAISSSTLSGAERHRNPVYFGAVRIVIHQSPGGESPC